MGSIRKHGQTGFLFFDFRYQGVRCREYTALPETATNKKKLEKILRVIEADITAGSFEYRRFF
ncbi:MAG: Arm DNA-binding domain-containing protein, partial [Anaerolineales bacterium]